MTTRNANNANNAFIGHCLRIDELMARLAALRADHFGADAEQPRNWGEVGSVEQIASLLERAVKFAEGQPD